MPYSVAVGYHCFGGPCSLRLHPESSSPWKLQIPWQMQPSHNSQFISLRPIVIIEKCLKYKFWIALRAIFYVMSLMHDEPFLEKSTKFYFIPIRIGTNFQVPVPTLIADPAHQVTSRRHWTVWPSLFFFFFWRFLIPWNHFHWTTKVNQWWFLFSLGVLAAGGEGCLFFIAGIDALYLFLRFICLPLGVTFICASSNNAAYLSAKQSRPEF
jgi:hypothetical protein